MATNTRAAAVAAVDLFKVAFPGAVTGPDDGAKYEAHVTKPWATSCWTRAAAYLDLKNADEVSTALAIVRKTGCKFAFRTTGHNPNVGFSSADESGVVLDISQLKAMELGPDGVARLGAGATWKQTYEWLERQGLSVMDGRDPEVGLGGFLLGGTLFSLQDGTGHGLSNGNRRLRNLPEPAWTGG
jgi:FAD/FMN-containing dehydrogenase